MVNLYHCIKAYYSSERGDSSPRYSMCLPPSFSMHGVCLWRTCSPSISVNKVQLALILFVVIGSRMDRWPKQSQGYTVLSHLLELLRNRDSPCFPLVFELWGHEPEANVSHRTANGWRLPDKRTNQAEGKWRHRETLDLWHGLSPWIKTHQCASKFPLGLQQFVLSLLSFGIKRPQV